MTGVAFTTADGAVVHVRGHEGDRLLDVAQAAGMPLEGTCEGQMACSTCHVHVDPQDFGRLPPASADEEDILDFAAHVGRTSRLACQILLSRSVGDLRVTIPGARC